MNRPRVLVFSLAYFPFVGGAEVAVKELVERLSGDFEFDLITANLAGGFWPKYFFPLTAYREARRRQRRRAYDLVWAIMANQAGMAATLFKKSFPDVPFLLTLQEGDDLKALSYRLRLLGPKIFGVFRRADRIQAISHYLARWVKQMGAVCPIDVIPNGVDLDSFQLLAVSDQAQKEKTIITASRLVRKNGVDILIRALAFLPFDVKLQILGTGPQEAALKSLTDRLKLAPRVSFLGQVEPSLVGQYLIRGSVFARPSRSEGLGNSFLEAMAAGLPVIGTVVGGIPDFLRHGETGWLCRAEDPRDLAEKIKFVLDPENRGEVSRIARAGQKLAREKYNWEIVASRMKTLFYKLIDD